MIGANGNRRLEGRVVIVIGGGTGIGRAAAIACARRGAHVLVAGRRPEPLRKTETADPAIESITADVTAEAENLPPIEIQ